MDGALALLWLLRLLFLLLLYVFLYRVVRALLHDLRIATHEATAELGRLVVVASPAGEPVQGTALSLDAITSLGRDVNNSIVVDDPFASSEHAILTFRGRGWYLEDLQSTNGTYVNGTRIEAVAPLTFGDEIQIGQVRLRLERARR
jgi:pSer/pThr/pTyr-binding forkhead associated (FHA) protein